MAMENHAWRIEDFNSPHGDVIYLDAAGKSPLPKIVAATGHEALLSKVIIYLLTNILRFIQVVSHY
jgi:hypothetical protein